MSSPELIHVAMPPETLRVLQDSVQAGDYASTSEAMQDAVRVWQQQREGHAQWLEVVRDRIGRSFADPRPDLSSEDVEAGLMDIFRADPAEHGSA